MNKHQDFFSKTQSRSGFSNGVIRTPEKKGGAGFIFVIFFVLIIFGGLSAAWFLDLLPNFQNFFEVHDQEQRIENPYTIGKQVQIEGILKEENSDLISYTHTLTTSSGDIFLLKSKTRPLNNYSTNLTGVIQIIGTIEAFYHNKPVVEVHTVGTQTTQEIPQSTTGLQASEVNNPGVYLSHAGLYFGQEFFDTYAFIEENRSDNIIRIKNLENEKVTTINAFSCKNSGDQNCKENERVFKNSSGREITNQDGITFYRLSEVKSWFFQNNNWRGYFINDAEDSEVENIIKLIRVSSPSAIKDSVTLYGVKTCLGTDNGLNKIVKHTVEKTAEGILVNMEGNGEKAFICQATFNPSLPNNFQFIDLQTKTETNTPLIQDEMANTSESKLDSTKTKSDEKKEEKSGSALSESQNQAVTHTINYNPNVPQFPINLEKTLQYTSSRGSYKMAFPSMNIAYEASAIDTDLGEAGFRCKYGINIIQYKNKDLIKAEPTLTIYECGNKKQLTNPKENYLIKELGDKQFIIEIHDGSWLDFAKNISISSI